MKYLQETDFNISDIYTQENIPGRLESDGTLRTFDLAGCINELIERNAFLVIDEIESSLHPQHLVTDDYEKKKSYPKAHAG